MKIILPSTMYPSLPLTGFFLPFFMFSLAFVFPLECDVEVLFSTNVSDCLLTGVQFSRSGTDHIVVAAYDHNTLHSFTSK